MFEAIRNLYKRGRIDVEGVRAAAAKGLITAEQCAEILGEDDS